MRLLKRHCYNLAPHHEVPFAGERSTEIHSSLATGQHSNGSHSPLKTQHTASRALAALPSATTIKIFFFKQIDSIMVSQQCEDKKHLRGKKQRKGKYNPTSLPMDQDVASFLPCSAAPFTLLMYPSISRNVSSPARQFECSLKILHL